MAETPTTSQNQKEEQSFVPGPLTQQEIELLRKEAKEARKKVHEFYQKKYGNKSDEE